MEAKLKHLEFIQNVITRMNSNSFKIKGWTITIVSALFALVANNSNPNLLWAGFIAIPVFWVLDGFFLSNERKYRELYQDVIKKTTIDFNMDASSYNNGDRKWICSIFSSTLNIFYGLLLILTLIGSWLAGLIQICCRCSF